MSLAEPESSKRHSASRRMPFRAPRPNRAVLGICTKLLPRILLKGYDIVSVGYRDGELQRFRELLEHRVLITPNHPTHAEPALLFHLSRQVGVDFLYLSNRESFDRLLGLFGWLLTRTGAYSIVRGAPDRESFKFTRRVLAEKRAPLVIFPEGEVYSQNDSLLPFQAGVFQLAFLALDDMAKAGHHAPLFVQPVAIRYRFVEDMRGPIRESLARLESKLGLAESSGNEPYPRLRRIGDAVLTAAEKAYRLPQGGSDDLNPRIDAVRERIVQRVAEALDLEETELGRTLPDRMRALINRVNRISTDEPSPASAYQDKLLREEGERIRPLNRDLQRLANWIAVRDGYVGELATQERLLDTLWRLESEVLGQRVLRGKRECWLRLAEPIDLATYLHLPRKEAIQSVTLKAETSIQALLEDMALKTTDTSPIHVE